MTQARRTEKPVVDRLTRTPFEVTPEEQRMAQAALARIKTIEQLRLGQTPRIVAACCTQPFAVVGEYRADAVMTVVCSHCDAVIVEVADA
jgi:L-asparaginase II